MQRALLSALCCVTLAVAGCATKGRAPDGGDGPKKSSPNAIQPSPMQVLGRVLAIDSRSLTVIVELGPYSPLPVDIGTHTLLCRQDDLRPTARLQASPYLRGRTLGATLLAGRPNIGDEVILEPTVQ